jgi:arylsulfatase A-like enzyme
VISVAVLLALLAAVLPCQADPKPNIVLILADDLGYGDPGCYNEESKIPTPHIDRLASEGMRFTDAHSPSSVCTPTRYGLLTGRYAWRTDLRKGVLWPWDPPLLEDERVTLPELLRAEGYRTACIGKWHLGWDWPLDEDGSVRAEFDGHTWDPKRRGEIGLRVDWDRPVRGGPLAHGFDSYFGDDVPNFPPYTFIEDERVLVRPTATKPEEMFGHAGPAAPGWDLAGVMPRLTQRACAWLDEHARSGNEQPFFLYMPLTAPHTPIAPSPAFRGRSGAGTYGDFVHEVDWSVGQVLATLDRNGLRENTLVVFTSDNGSPQRDGTDMSGPVGSVRERFGHDASRPWRGLKSDAWEGGHRVPFLVRWPSKVQAGAVSDQPVVHTDLFRTLASLVGHELTADSGEDSFDIGAILFAGSPSATPARDHLVHHSGGGLFAIRVGRWKLILGKGSGGFSRWKPPGGAPAGQLYDLAEDPEEQDNQYAARPEIVARLTARLEEIQERGRSAELPGR